MWSREARRTKIIHCSGSFGGTTLPQAAGSRFRQRAICRQSWRRCQVRHGVFKKVVTPVSFIVQSLISVLSFLRVPPAVLHGNNLLVFGGTGIPFGENNGNDVHVCNVKYKRWSLLNCQGKKPNRIYGQVTWTCQSLGCIERFQNAWGSRGGHKLQSTSPSLNICTLLGNGNHKWLPLRVWWDNGLHLQHWPAQAGPDDQGVDPPQAKQLPWRLAWGTVTLTAAV